MTEQELLKKIGQNIKEITAKKGVSQLMLAGDEVSKGNSYQIETKEKVISCMPILRIWF